MNTKPKILIVFCGGTIVQKMNKSGAIDNIDKDSAIELLLGLEPSLSLDYDMDVFYVDNIDSANMNPKHWEKMAEVIHKKYDDYDGFVVTHGTHTMAYTSSALSFLLPDIGKPVVFTGAQIPGYLIESDASRNFVNAVRVASLDISGIFIVFDEEILYGTRVSKVSESRLDAYDPINSNLAGEIRTKIIIDPTTRKRHNKKIKKTNGFCSEVMVITMFPEMPAQILENIIDQSYVKGVIIRGYGPGDIPSSFLPVIEKARDKEISILMNSQCLQGATDMRTYTVGFQMLEKGVIECHDMSLEATATKLMWALENYKYADIQSIMQTDIAREIDIPSK